MHDLTIGRWTDVLSFQHFSENPYFSDKVLIKEYRYVAPPAAKDEKPDELGLTPSMIDFDWERDIEPQSQPIAWKSDAVNITKLHPRILSEEEDDGVAEAGSIFNLFTEKKDPLEVCLFSKVMDAGGLICACDDSSAC